MHLQGDRSDGGVIRALISEIRKDDDRVTVDLAGRVKKITLDGLPHRCLPSQEAANKLATLKSKAVKAGVAEPFPYIELAEFLPNWAMDVRCFCYLKLLFFIADNLQVDCAPEADDTQEGAPRTKKKKMDMIRWITAFHSFALAADATEVPWIT
jgi:hypothetical protein